MSTTELTLPPIRAYTKKQICLLLVDPGHTESKPTPCTGYSRAKLKRLIMGTTMPGGGTMLEMLGISSEQEYDRIRVFSPRQVELILREFL